ncbi:MAG: rhodanese-like domain-containing protein [Cyanobacteriota bacterium]
MSFELIECETSDLLDQSDRASKYFKEKLAFEMDPKELIKKLYSENIKIIDVRDFEDYAEYHITGAISIPINKLRQKIQDLRKDKLNVVYGYDTTCTIALTAAFILAENGYKVVCLSGGFKYWSQRSFPIERI